MSTVKLDRYAIEPPDYNLLAGNPVTSEDWKSIARLQNWIMAGRVQVIIPPTLVNASVAAAGTEKFRFYASRNFEHLTMLWAIQFDAPVDSRCSGTHGPTGAAATQNYTVYEDDLSSKLHWFLRQNLTQFDSALELTYDVTCDSGSAATTVRWLAAYGLPRTRMAPPSTSIVTSINSLESGQPIGNQQADSSIGLGVATNNEAMHEKIYRNQFHWTCDDGDTTLIRTTTNTVTFDAVFSDLEPIFLGRIKFNGDTTYTLRWRVRAKGNGKVRITMDSGATATINANFGASFAWSSESTIAVDAELLTSADGRRASRWDHMTIEFQANSGTFEVAGVSVYDRGGT